MNTFYVLLPKLHIFNEYHMSQIISTNLNSNIDVNYTSHINIIFK